MRASIGKRSRPRRLERRAANAALNAARAARAERWAHGVLIGSIAASIAVIVLSAVIVAASEASTLRWGVVWPSRHGSVPLEFDIARGHVLPVAALLLAAPLCLAVVGLVQTREMSRAARQDRSRYLSLWSTAGGGAAAALAPNVLGCLWLSATRPDSELIFLPEVWPAIAVFLWPIPVLVWELLQLAALKRS